MREGWTFEGWYTGEVTEEFLGDGEPETSGAEFQYPEKLDWFEGKLKGLLGDDSIDIYKDGVNNEYANRYHHKWFIRAEGKKAGSDTVLTDVACLHAKYEPKTVRLKFLMNGWKGQYSEFLHSDGRQYGSVFSLPDLNGSDYPSFNWAGHEFIGWSLSPTGEGTVYKVAEKSSHTRIYWIGDESEDAIPIDDGAIVLYAVYEDMPKDMAVTVEMLAGSDPLEPGAWNWNRLKYSISPYVEGTEHEVEWSTNRPDIISLVNVPEKGQINVSADADAAAKETETATVTATVNGQYTGSIAVHVGHHWDGGKIYTERNPKDPCSAERYAIYTCTWNGNCGKTKEIKLGPVGHTWTEKDVPATCTEDGYRGRVCSACGATEITETYPAEGHKMDEGKKTHGCGGTVTIKTCSACGRTETTSDRNGAVHEWESTKRIDKAPTCHTEGSMSCHCSECGATRDSEPIPADPSLHRWTGWTVKKQTSRQGPKRSPRPKRQSLPYRTGRRRQATSPGPAMTAAMTEGWLKAAGRTRLHCLKADPLAEARAAAETEPAAAVRPLAAAEAHPIAAVRPIAAEARPMEAAAHPAGPEAAGAEAPVREEAA